MTTELSLEEFAGRLDNSLDRVQLLLSREKAVGLQIANEDCSHTYEDKYVLIEQSASAAILAILNDLQFVGLKDEQLLRAKDWSRESTVSVRLDQSQRCKYLREEIRKESSDVSTNMEFSLGSLTAKSTSKVVTKITEYFYELECTWKLSLVRGMGVDESNDVMEIASRVATQECVQRSKEFPFPESSSHSESCEMRWALDWLQRSQNGSGWVVSVRIDRSKKDCFTPSRNADIKSLMESLMRLLLWAGPVQQYFHHELWSIHSNHHRQGHNKIDIIGVLSRPVFMPLQPLFRDLSNVDRQNEQRLVLQDAPPNQQRAGGLQFASSNSDSTSIASQRDDESSARSGSSLGEWEVNTFLSEHVRSLHREAAAMQELFPSAAVTTNCLLSQLEAGTLMALHHMERVVEQFWSIVALVESMLRRQLVRAIGKELTPTDFGLYMQYHYRRLFRPAYRPQVWNVSVRRTETHAPEGSVRIESRISSELTHEGFQPLECFCASQVLPKSASGEGYASIALNAATRIMVGGERHVHGWLGHRFSNSGPVATDLRLSVTTRQFSGFIVLLGRMTSGKSFDAKHGFLVQNTEELVVPLLLETIPNAQQFREAISSLSAEQQRFAQAYRSMQLESTLFGICIVQVKPQLEKVLNLPADSLTKEIQLTQDLLKLFVQYQISADLLSYEPPPPVPAVSTASVSGRLAISSWVEASTREKVDTVRDNVHKIMDMLEGMKKEEVRQKNPEGMRVFLKTLTGKTEELSLDLFDESVDSLKQKIYELNGTPVDQQRIIFAGTQLESRFNVQHYGIHRDCTLHLILRLRGGPSTSEVLDLINSNIEKVMERGEKLDDLSTRSEHLQQSAVKFNKSSRKSSISGGFGSGIMGMLGGFGSKQSRNQQESYGKANIIAKSAELMANESALQDAALDALSAQTMKISEISQKINQCEEMASSAIDVMNDAVEPIEIGGPSSQAEQLQTEQSQTEQSQSTSQLTLNIDQPHLQPQQRQQLFTILSDVTKVPKLLDDAFDRLDLDHAVRPAILNLGEVWRHRKARPLSQRSAGQSSSLTTCPAAGEEEAVNSVSQAAMRQQAFDLLDALTRSGGLACEDAALHIVVAATHTFDESVLETVVRRNMNPIEAVERSSMIMASVLHDLPGHCLVKSSEVGRLQSVSSAATAVLGL